MEVHTIEQDRTKCRRFLVLANLPLDPDQPLEIRFLHFGPVTRKPRTKRPPNPDQIRETLFLHFGPVTKKPRTNRPPDPHQSPQFLYFGPLTKTPGTF
jgi:hypothetical protein